MGKKIVVIGAGTAAWAYLKLLNEAAKINVDDEIIVLGQSDPWAARVGKMGQREDVHSLTNWSEADPRVNPISGFKKPEFNLAKAHADTIESWKAALTAKDNINYIECRVEEIIGGKKYRVMTNKASVDEVDEIVIATGAGDQRQMDATQWAKPFEPPYYSGADFLDGSVEIAQASTKILIYGGGATAAWCVRKACELCGEENVTWLVRVDSKHPNHNFKERTPGAWLTSGINSDIEKLVDEKKIQYGVETIESTVVELNKITVTTKNKAKEKGEHPCQIIVGALGQSSIVKAITSDLALDKKDRWEQIKTNQLGKEATIALKTKQGKITVIGAAVSTLCDEFWPDDDPDALFKGLARFSIKSAQVPAGIPYLLKSIFYFVEGHTSTIGANMLSPKDADSILTTAIERYIKSMWDGKVESLLGHSIAHVISVITDQIIGFRKSKNQNEFGLSQEELDELWWLLRESSFPHFAPPQDDVEKLLALKVVLDDEHRAGDCNWVCDEALVPKWLADAMAV